MDYYNNNDVRAIFFTKNINSGSFFLHSLLDGHDQIVVMPVIYNYYILKERENVRLDPVKFIDTYFDRYWKPILKKEPGISESIEKEFDIDNKNKIKQAYKEIVKSRLKKTFTLIDFFVCLGLAYWFAKDKGGKQPKAIFIPLHFLLTNLDRPTVGDDYFEGSFMQEIIDDPRAQLLHILRDPRANYASGVYGDKLGGRHALYAFLEVYREYYNSIQVFRGLLGKRYFIVQNEFLHLFPDKTLQSLVQWIGIEFSETLKYSTMCGVSWEGNSCFGPIKTFDPSLHSNKKWIAQLSKHEILLLECYLGRVLDEYKYERLACIPRFYLCLTAWWFLIFLVDRRNPNKNMKSISRYRMIIKSIYAACLVSRRFFFEEKVIKLYPRLSVDFEKEVH